MATVNTSDTGKVSQSAGDLTVTAYPGEGMILIAMSLGDGGVNENDKNLAGFAIYRTEQGNAETPLPNRLSFASGITRDSTAQEWFPSADSPFQKFRWVDVPPNGFDNPMTYRVVAKYFSGSGTTLKDGPSATVTVFPPQRAHTDFDVAFTRGYASSQAYVDKFDNKDIRPKTKTPTFDTKPYQEQYVWLGAKARTVLFGFLDECRKDPGARVDVFAYDLDEPDVIKAICQFGREKRLRAILDNAPLHTKPTAVEPQAAALIKTATGAANVKQGHFGRFQHNKVFIKRAHDGTAQRVLFGSMNFSLRGIYVQANNVMLISDATAAGYFAKAFDEAFQDGVKQAPFANSAIAQSYNSISSANTASLPQSMVALSPHKSSDTSLGPMSQAVRAASSSVLFAVMEPSGSGPVLETLREIAARPTVFSYGTVETDTGLHVQNGAGSMSDVTPYSFLKSKVPAPFKAEWNGGNGMHIHHKFVVVDFNGDKPIVFTGSSNLAAGGEEQNGDSLIQIQDPVIASMYAIEAVRLFDHYAFRRNMAKATTAKPLFLWSPASGGAPWWKPYYDRNDIKFRDRYLFACLPLPAGVATVKQADWSKLDRAAASAQARPRKAPSAARTKARAPARQSTTTAKTSTRKRPAAKPKRNTRGQRPPAKRSGSRRKSSR